MLRGENEKRQTADDKIPCFLEPELTGKTSRRNWARLIQKIYEVDPLVCPKCFGAMHIIAFIENPDVMKKILKHLGLWDVKRKPRPVANAPPIDVFPAYDEQPGPSADDYIRDPDLPCRSLLLKNLKREDRLLISKIHYFQPILANCRVDITIFILCMGLYWMEPVGAWCRISSGPICCYSSPNVTQPYQP